MVTGGCLEGEKGFDGQGLECLDETQGGLIAGKRHACE